MRISKVLLATMVASIITGSVFATPTTGNNIVGGTDNVVSSTYISSAVWWIS